MVWSFAAEEDERCRPDWLEDIFVNKIYYFHELNVFISRNAFYVSVNISLFNVNFAGLSLVKSYTEVITWKKLKK